jgi:hypothetical protein
MYEEMESRSIILSSIVRIQGYLGDIAPMVSYRNINLMWII